MMRRRIHRAFPEKEDASPSRPGAFQPRPFAPPAVQRYSIVQPNDANAGKMLPSQALDRSRTTTQSNDKTQVTQKLSWVAQSTNNPPLKVSEHGRLAIESTAGQPKVFYGTEADIEKSRQRLIDIGSRITLKANSSETLQVPKNPKDINSGTRALVQVEPEKGPGIGNDEELMDANECDSVSQRIVGGKQAVIGNGNEGFTLAGEVNAKRGDINHIATAIHGTRERESIAAFPQKYQQAKQSFPNVRDPNLNISPEIQEYFATGTFRRKHLVPSPRILKALSLPGIPKGLLEQIYEIHVRKEEEQRPDEDYVLNHIKKVLQVQRVLDYQPVRDDRRINERLGVNESAAPEVGESFSILAQTSLPVVDENGILSHEIGFSGMDDNGIRGVLNGLFATQNKAILLGTLAERQYLKMRGVIPFQEHHAAVMAGDGADTVTFENYNRAAEEATLKTELWEKLFREFRDFDHQIRKSVENVKGNQEREPAAKLNDITRLRLEQLNSMREDFVAVQADTETVLKVESNLGGDDNKLWHFNMYGPGDQSFHQAWSPAVANAITVRTTGLADGGFKEKLKQNLATQAEALEKTKGVSSQELLQDLAGRIDRTKTRVEAMDAYKLCLELMASRAEDWV